MITYTIFNVVFLVIFIFYFLFIVTIIFSKKKKQCGNIAHACGIIDSHIYTNSLEALHKSYSNGYRNIEIDLLNMNGHIVGGHDWNLFRLYTNYNSSNEFNIHNIKKLKILNKYNLIYDFEINSVLKQYNDLNIFTDKITDCMLLKKYVHKIDRLCVEVFTKAQYNECTKLGFKHTMLNINYYNELNQLLIENNTIRAITTNPHIFYFYKNILLQLYMKGIKIYVYSVVNKTIINLALCKYVNGFYVDN